MKNNKMKTLNACLLLWIIAGHLSITAQNKNLSFLFNQESIKFEFVSDRLTIKGEQEDSYLGKVIAKLNRKKANAGEIFLNEWKKAKSENAPHNFLFQFNKYLEEYYFKGVTDSNNPKYVCVVELISIKTGIPALKHPTLWLSYTFYETNNRDRKIAQLKSHIIYARDSYTRIHGVNSTWTQIWMAYHKDGIAMAKKIKRAAKLKRDRD